VGGVSSLECVYTVCYQFSVNVSSLVGSRVMTVSVSSSRVWKQSFFACVFYFKPLWSKFISLLEKEMLVVLIALAEKVYCSCVVILCACVNFGSFLSRALYLVFVSLRSFLQLYVGLVTTCCSTC